MKWLIIVCLPFISVGSGVQSQSLVVTSLPAVLFQTNGGVHNITAGSVLQLYCLVRSINITASFSWTKDRRPVMIDVPHLRERTCNDDMTAISVLTVDSFQSQDSGTYQCMAVDRNTTGYGKSVSLRAVINGSLTAVHPPVENETLFEQVHHSVIEDNRTGIPLGSQVSMDCAVETSNNALQVQILWIRDGKNITVDSTHSISIVTLNSTLQITNFALNDAGVYQCIFNTETELMITRPFRLQTDIVFEGASTVFLERVSPEVIFLRPPEKLVIEVKATGRYRNILWQKNAVSCLVQPQQFPNYNEMLVYSTTTQDDLTLYEVSLRAASIISQRNVPQELDFLVVSPVDANTTIINGLHIAQVIEGSSVTISCTSTGAPTPSISWTLDGHPVSFQSTEMVTKEQSTLVCSDPNNQNSPLVPNIVLGTIISNLLVTNSRYPDHDGVYTCTGSNDISVINVSSATINVQVIVPPQVEVIASSSHVVLGGSTILFCNITRTNPGIVGAYVWTKENTGGRILENSDTLRLNLSAVTDFGTYSCTVTNRAGEVGRRNITITKQEAITTESFLQLRISPVDNCVSWTERNHSQKQADIIAHIVSIITRACSCGFSESGITESAFSCRSSETQVVFKARLSYTSEVGSYSADDLVTFFSSWVSSGSSISVTGTIFSVDPTCPTKVESLTDEDCIIPDLSDTLNTNVNIIWSSALGGGIVVVVIIIIIIIVTVSLLKCAHQRKKLTLSSSHELQPQSKVTEESAAPPVYETVPMSGEANCHNPTMEPNIAYTGVQVPAMEANIAYETFGFQQTERSSESVDPNTCTVEEEEPVYD